MRKNIFILLLVLTLSVCAGCGDFGTVKVYEDTEEYKIVHEERRITAVITGIDLDNNLIDFMDCEDGSARELIYHGGVSVTNTRGKEIGIDTMVCGMVVDIVYYNDTLKLVSIAANPYTEVIEDAGKLTLDMDEAKAVYNGSTFTLSEYLKVFDDGKEIEPMEISTEDQVTLNIYGNKLISVIVETGHGYVRLVNQDTYIGGMVEIGYDVIVPVTDDMLIAVREGEYTLRINKNDYCDSMNVSVKKNKETLVDLTSIAIPTGTATFSITPSDAQIFINGNKLDGYAYSNIYGTYELKIKADGYNTFNGSFKISQAVKVFTIELTELETTEEETTEETTTETAAIVSTTESPATATEETSGQSASDSDASSKPVNTISGNIIKVNSPVGVGVYVDGEYVGIAPVSFKKEAGTHNILLYQTGYLIKSYTITATDDGQDDEYNFAALTSLSDLLE